MSGPRNQTPDLSVCACGLHVLLLSALGSLFRNMHIYPQCRAVQSTQNHPDTEYLQSPKAEEKKRQLGPKATLVGIVVVQKKQSST